MGAKDLPSDSRGPRFTAKALWPQDPIQESLISLSNEDMNKRAVAGFKGEWTPDSLLFELPLDQPIRQHRKPSLPTVTAGASDGFS